MNKPIDHQLLSATDAQAAWQDDYARTIGDNDHPVRNRSGIPIKPLYTASDWSPSGREADLGMPGQAPYTRGIYATMHRGRTWTQR